ncbi:class Ib ribonucleoside-diphosphate reductase assembly flavoprotein NrdI [Candidatus Mycoplasma haematohominis]|uniref:Putative NrdI-like protein n=1 Tax=Candidatus Mycoplasma haematohominis TaxID=1494318 RepID=A0A478FQR4_9MOLU|nr:class Ib ribonucleoside-diphosphate reductase assembly flavoprotein NrdI [Candidatus Mycoplasma haemohominis]GCE63284.1 putative NrdI-like protein [Candidatus Mycoplasma haemohominis]
MKLVYASRTNNIERIVQKLNLPEEQLLNISNGYSGVINEEYCLFTYTDMLGSIPKVVDDFLKINHKYLKGVAGSGNRNFGANFCLAAEKISIKYGVELLAKFELAGSDKEIERFKKKYKELFS